MKFRKDAGYSSDFDAYLSDIAISHMAETKRLIETLNRDTDVSDLDYEIVLQMEYAWHTCQYEEGCSICDELLNALRKRDGETDPVIRGILDKEIELVSIYKLFFSFLLGDDSALPDDSMHFQWNQSYDIEFTVSVNDAVADFCKDPAHADREKLKCHPEYGLGTF